MMHRSTALFVALSTLAVTATTALAHEDDPKAKHWEPPFVGPPWRAAIEGGQGGVAETFASDGVQLLSWFPVTSIDAAATSGNDCWGYVSASGREYAIIGVSNGTGIVEVTDPEAAQLIEFLPGPTSLWRNVKTYQHWLYAVSEGGGGIQVFDLAQIDSGIVTTLPSVTTGGGLSTHTMIINEATGYLYRMGGGSNGIRVYNLAPNPASPTYVGAWSQRYVHDGCVFSYTSGPYAGKEIFFACGGMNGGFDNTGVSIIDVTNKASMTVLSTFYYANAAFCHQIWLTADLKYGYINDEIDEQNFGIYSKGRIVDLTNLSAPTLAGTFDTGLPTVDHNEYVKGDFLYCSNYKSGLRVFDITDRTNPEQIAWFDTYPADDTAGYAGLWSNYPFLPSGTVLGSDIQRGLFIWRVSNNGLEFSYPDGLPANLAPAGGQTVTISITATGDAALDPLSPVMQLTVGDETIDVPMSSAGGSLWLAVTPPLECGAEVGIRFIAATTDGEVDTDPAAPSFHPAVASLGSASAWTDSMEATNGWSTIQLDDTAITGRWTRVDPIGTAAQPEDDHTAAPGAACFVTAQGSPGGSLGEADVDGGKTTLTSPLLDASGLGDPRIEYWRWYSNNTGSNPYTNSMLVQISNNDGANWTTLETVTENLGVWVRKSWRIADFVAPTATMRLRFVASDNTNSIVEAGVDDVTLFEYLCGESIPGDLDGNGVVDGSDLGSMLGDWGACPGCPSDLNGDGAVDGDDLGVLLGNWS